MKYHTNHLEFFHCIFGVGNNVPPYVYWDHWNSTQVQVLDITLARVSTNHVENKPVATKASCGFESPYSIVFVNIILCRKK